jgi:hypothetical protein
MSGNLSISVGGNLSMAAGGSLAVDGQTQLQAGGNVALGDVTIGRANAAANLSITAGSSSGISQTAGKLLKVFGNTVLSAGSGGIVLANDNGANALNDWVGTVSLSSAGVATLRDSTRLSIAQASTSGAMSLTAASDISLGTVSVGSAQAAADLSVATGAALSQLAAATLTVSGQTSLSAVTDITLDNRSGASVALNDFGGQLSVSTARDVLVSDKNALALSAQSVRALTVAAAGALSLGPVSATTDLVASGNFTLAGNLSGRSVSLTSSATLNMAGYTITATDTDGQVQVQAQGDITLGRIRAINGDVRVQSTSGSVLDGLLSTERVIATGGAVAIQAGSSSAMTVRLWDTLGNGTYTADTGALDVMAGHIDDLRAAGGVTVGIGSGGGSTFTGVLETAGTLTLNFGSAGIQMAAGSALRAGQNLSLVSTGNLTLAEVSAGQTVSIQTTGAITALSATDTAQAANVKGASVLLSGSAIGSASQALRVDALSSGSSAGVIRLVSTPSTPTAGNAYLDITTALDGSTRRTVELGSTSDDWTIGGLLQLNARTANLVLKGHITAGRIDMAAEQGSLSMSEGKILRSDGQINLSGQSGVSLARIVGSSTDTSQQISVRSDAGLITDLSVDELANLSTAGELLLSARSMGGSGSADIDVQAGRLQSLSATTGAIFIESLATTATAIGTVSAAGAFDLRVGTGRTELEGHLTAGLINIDSAGSLSQADNTVLSTAGSANLRSGGDIALARLIGGNGSVSIAATGDLTDASSSTAANIVMGTGSLSIEARRIGSDSEALEIDAGNVALIKANETTLMQTAIHVTATRAGDTTTLAKLETVAGARWTQSTGHLALTGALSARALDLQVTAGDLRQNSGTLTVQSDLALLAGGHIALSSMTSTGGNISLQAGASILDATSNAETVLLNTAASGKTISLQAASGIGTDNGSGDIEISTDQLTLARTTQGGIYLSSARSLMVGEVTAADQASVNLSNGSLTLSDSFSGDSVQLGVAAGALTMGANATVLGRTQVTLASAQDMAITRVLASGPDAQVALTSGGVLLDVSGAEPGQAGGWNIEANGTVSLEALAIGQAGNDFDVRAGQIARTANSAGAWLRTDLYDASAGGTVVLSADAISGSGRLNMILMSGDLLVTQSFSANTVDLRALGGRIEMSDGVVLTAVGDMNLVSGQDMVLSRLVTNTGRITLQAGGRIIDGSNSELANITGTQSSANLDITASRVGSDQPVVDERQVIDLGGATGGRFKLSLNVDGVIRTTADITANTGVGDTRAALDARISQALVALDFTGATYSVSNGEITFGGSLQKRDLPTLLLDASALTGTTAAAQIVVSQEGGVPGDINLNIAKVNRINGGALGVYLQSERSLEVGTLGITGDLAIELTTGDLLLAGSQSARDIRYSAVSGRLTMNDGVVATAAGSADLYAYRDLRLSRLVVAGTAADARVVSELGALIDNSAGEGVGQENIVVQTGTLTQLKGQSVGSRFVGGELDVNAQQIGTVQASRGGAFVQITGAQGGQARITELVAIAAGADVGVSVTQGGLRVDSAQAADQLSIQVEGSTGSAQGQLTLGQLSAGGDLTLSNRLGGIAHSNASSVLRADSQTALTRLSAGGDIDLSGSLNDFATLRIDAAANAQVRDRNDLNLGAVTVSGDLSLRSGSTVTVLQSQSVTAGRHASVQLDSGTLTLAGGNTVRAQTGDLSIGLASGSLAGLGSSTLAAGRDVLMQAQGQVGLGGATQVTAGRSVEVNFSGSLSTSGTTQVSAQTGRIAITGSSGQLSLSGTTSLLAATGVDIGLTQGSWSTAAGSTTTVRASDGALTAMLGNGSVTWRGTTSLEADSISVRANGAQASLSAQNSTSLSADRGDLVIALERGSMSLQGSSSMSAARHLSLQIAGPGPMSLSGASTLSAGSAQLAGDLSLSVAVGDLSMRNASTLRASQDLRLNLAQGSWRTSGATTLSAGRDTEVNIPQGSATLTQRTVIDAGGSASLSAERGINASGLTDLLAGANLRLAAQQGGVGLNNTSALRANADDISVTLGTGDLRIADDSLWQAGRDLTVSIDTGDLLALNQTTWSAGRDVQVQIGSGQISAQNSTTWTAGQDVQLAITTGALQTRQSTEVNAGRDIGVRLGAGSIGLNDTSLWTAGRDQGWQTRDAGQFTMSDSETALVAGRDLNLDIAQTVRIDWLQAGNAMNIRSASGAILDNTAAETDLLAARHLALDASQGIGLNWSNNLNTYVTGTLTAINRDSGGINLQNWVGLALTPQGVSNRGESNIVLISGGTIEHGEVLYQTSPGTPRSISNPQGQKIYVIHNQPGLLLLEQWGNRTPTFIDTRASVPESAQSGKADIRALITPASLIPTSGDGQGLDAANRLLQSLQAAGQNLPLSQPIKLADVLRESRDGQPRNIFGANLLPEIQGLASEVGGADLLRTQMPPAIAPTPAETEPVPAAEPQSQLPKALDDLALMERPVLRQALLLADDNLDLPLIDEVANAAV